MRTTKSKETAAGKCGGRTDDDYLKNENKVLLTCCALATHIWEEVPFFTSVHSISIWQ